VDRCALFVDASYALSDGAMAVHGTRRRDSVTWNHAGLLTLLAGLAKDRTGLPVLRCYWYEAAPEGRTAEQDALAEMPGLKLRLVNTRPGRREGIETQLRRDLVTLAKNGAISDAFIASADEHLAEIVAEVQDLGLRVVVLHIASDGGWTIPQPLRQECDDIVEISAVHLRPFVELVRGAEPPAISESYARSGYEARGLPEGGSGGVMSQPAGYGQPAAAYAGPQAVAGGHGGPGSGGPGAHPGPGQAGAQPGQPGGQQPSANGLFSQNGHTGSNGYAGLNGQQAPAGQPALPGGHQPGGPGQPGGPAQYGTVGAAGAPGAGGQAAGHPVPGGLASGGPTPGYPGANGGSYQNGAGAEGAAHGGPAEPPGAPGAQAPSGLANYPAPEGPLAANGYHGAGARDAGAPHDGPPRDSGAAPGYPARGYPAGPGGTAEPQPGVAYPQNGPQHGPQPGAGYPPGPPPNGGYPIGAQPSPAPPAYQAAPVTGQPQYYPPAGGSQFAGQPAQAPFAGARPSQGQAPDHGQPPQGALIGSHPQQYPAPPGGPAQQPAAQVPALRASQPVALPLPEAVKAAHAEGYRFGESVGRDAPGLWLEAVLARKPRMPSDLEARLLQGSALPIDSLLHDEVRHSLRRGFWDALESARR